MTSKFYKTKNKEKERCFLKNGAKMLEQIITSFNGKCNPIRGFSKEELIMATNNYHEDQFLHQDWNYILYKGTHEDRAISVKKFVVSSSDSVPKDDPVDLLTNEVSIASNMSNHKNVLKLLGCCLETEVPILVYEFPENGNLSDHIYLDNCQPLVWESRLRIATEVANAIAYLHNGTAKVIIHRDIKSRNIFLDQDHVAKLFEFQKSVAIPFGEDHVKVDELFGTRGFIPPELYTWGAMAVSDHSILTEKSDVYSFGVVLFEILTGKKVSNLLKHLQMDVSPVSLSRKCSSFDTEELRICIEELHSYCCDLNEVEEDTCIGQQLSTEINSEDDVESFWEGMKKDVEVTAHPLFDGSYLMTNILARNEGQLLKCTELILRCVKRNPDERPTMIEVGQALRSIKRLQDL